jgi:hypothetical protein
MNKRINITQAFITPDGKSWSDEIRAQEHLLFLDLNGVLPEIRGDEESVDSGELADYVITHKDEIPKVFADHSICVLADKAFLAAERLRDLCTRAEAAALPATHPQLLQDALQLLGQDTNFPHAMS